MGFLTILKNRWIIVSVLYGFVFFIGIRVQDLFHQTRIIQLIVYLILLFSILTINIVRISLTFSRAPKLGLYSHFPTTTALFRLIIALILSITLLSKSYNPILSFLYLTYFYLIVSTYDLFEYHQGIYRGVRIVLDFIFACILFLGYGGIRNLEWIIFLIPISVLARHYSPVKSIILTIFSLLFISFFTFYNFNYWDLYFNVENIRFWELYHKIGSGFSAYINNTKTLTNYLNWVNLKVYITIVIILLFVPSIFIAETKNRLKSVFNFTQNFYEFVKNNGKLINDKIITYLVEHLNAEIIIAINKMGFVQYALQKNTRNNFVYYDTVKLNTEQMEIFKKWWGMINDSIAIPNSSNINIDGKISFLGAIKNILLAKKIRDIDIEQFTLNDGNVIPVLEEKIIKLIPKLLEDRDMYRLYKNFRIASCVPFTILDYYVVVINNFPTKFRIVPRPFYEDGIQKIRAVKTIMT